MAMNTGGSSNMMRNTYTNPMATGSQSSAATPEKKKPQKETKKQPLVKDKESHKHCTGQLSRQSMQHSGGESIQQGQQTQRNANPAFLCKLGCETIQEIVARTCEVFSQLKTMPLPSGTNQGTQLSNEKKSRIQDLLISIQRQFKTLRAIYTRVNDDCAGMEYTHIESLIPYKDEGDNRSDMKKISDNFRPLLEEARDLREQLYLKARYMKEVIDQLRKIIWEVNTMLAMSNT